MTHRMKVKYTRASRVEDDIECVPQEDVHGTRSLRTCSEDSEDAAVDVVAEFQLPDGCNEPCIGDPETNSHDTTFMRVVSNFDGSWKPPVGFGKPLVFKAKGQLIRCYRTCGNWRLGRLLTTLATGWFPRSAAQQVDVVNKYVIDMAHAQDDGDYVEEADATIPPWVPVDMTETGACLRLRYTNSVGVYIICKCPETGKRFAAISSDRTNEVHIARIIVDDHKIYFAARPMDEFETIKDLVNFYRHQSLSSTWNIRCVVPFKTTCLVSYCIFGNYIKPSRFDDNEGGFETGTLPESGADDLLQMATDDIVVVTSKRTPKAEWWYGHVNTRFGFFHNSRVEEIGSLASDKVLKSLKHHGKLWCAGF